MSNIFNRRDERHLVTTPATAAHCPRCAVPTLTGHAEGQSYRVSVAPLSRTGELAALRRDHTTYVVYGTRSGLLARRDIHRIRAERHHTRPLVFAEHHCDITFTTTDIDAAQVTAVHRLLRRIRWAKPPKTSSTAAAPAQPALFTLDEPTEARHRRHGARRATP